MDVSVGGESLSRRDVLKGAAAAVGLSVIAGGLAVARAAGSAEDHNGDRQRGSGGRLSGGDGEHGVRRDARDRELANESGTVLAVDLTCTHKRCATKWVAEKNLFVCPCHPTP